MQGACQGIKRWGEGPTFSVSPLISHCLCNSFVCSTSILPAVWSRRHHVNNRRPALNDHRWNKRWKALKPQACCLCFPVPELPWLYDLIWLANGCTDNTDWILQRDARYVCGNESSHKFNGRLLLSIGPLHGKVPRTRNSQVRTWRVGNHHIPSVTEHTKNVSNDVVSRGL